MTRGVIQYDFGQVTETGWTKKHCHARPPDILWKAFMSLRAEHEFAPSLAPKYLRNALDQYKLWAESHERPRAQDYLFIPSYLHEGDQSKTSCTTCDLSKVVQRPDRPSWMENKIHHGVIASGNSLVRDAELRQKIAVLDKKNVSV